ncbi:unnamed protein product [Bemisia tabaci]|uniref:Uncharacterized protein n=1 Tax=Bemisia tabaci TaxID=7038 RepID=A0A9P0A4C0_BEMTA|nr:unnamed protein product [Bemisia tabaci]
MALVILWPEDGMRGVGLGSAVGVGGGVAGGGGGAGAGGVGGGRGRAGTGPSPEEYGLRASSLLELDELPIPGLQESPDRALDPRPHELNTTLLRAKLGKNFDPHLMSIFRPKDLYDAAAAAADAEDPDDADYTNEITPSRNRTAAPAPAPGFRRNKHGRLIPLGTMPQFIRDMDFRSVPTFASILTVVYHPEIDAFRLNGTIDEWERWGVLAVRLLAGRDEGEDEDQLEAEEEDPAVPVVGDRVSGCLPVAGLGFPLLAALAQGRPLLGELFHPCRDALPPLHQRQEDPAPLPLSQRHPRAQTLPLDQDRVPGHLQVRMRLPRSLLFLM